MTVQKIAIVGGGTAGWMTAAALCHLYETTGIDIVLIESDEIGSVGVGEATIPHLRYFNERLGIDEHEFMRETQATYKVGIEFSNWGRVGDSYIHPFGEFGFKTGGVAFHQYWLKALAAGYTAGIDDFSLPVAMAKHNKFAYPSADSRSIYASYSYAFHIDASRYARFLRKYCENKNARRTQFERIEGKITSVKQNQTSGNVEAVRLQSGAELKADFFIDCSGFRSLLVGNTLNTEFDDWSHWLPCDRAVAVPTTSVEPPAPFTKSIARDAGWQWKIPLQSRTGNGLVYSSEFMSDDSAVATLESNIEGERLADFNPIRFKAGRRRESWVNNCVAVGLSSGFLEPLESTSIYLIQVAIMKLVDLLPATANFDQHSQEFNRQMSLEYERIRDFLILHYHVTEREDTAFWSYCKNMEIPESLQCKMAAFKEDGYIATYEQGLFLEPSWVAVYLGQGLVPQRYHPGADRLADAELKAELEAFRKGINGSALKMPEHERILKEHCASGAAAHWPRASMSLYGVFS